MHCECPRVVMVKSLDCGIGGREFDFVHIRTDNFAKSLNTIILPAMG